MFIWANFSRDVDSESLVGAVLELQVFSIAGSWNPDGLSSPMQHENGGLKMKLPGSGNFRLWVPWPFTKNCTLGIAWDSYPVDIGGYFDLFLQNEKLTGIWYLFSLNVREMVENLSRNGGKSFENTDISGYVCQRKVIVSSVDFYFRRLCTPKKMASFPPLRPFPFCLASVQVRAPSGVVVEEIETLPMSLTLKLKVGKHRQLGASWVPDGVFFLHMKAPWILGVLQKTPVGVCPMRCDLGDMNKNPRWMSERDCPWKYLQKQDIHRW